MEKAISSNPSSEIKYSPSENLYENTVIIAKRAKQLMLQRRVDLEAELEQFVGEGESLADNLHHTSYREKIAKRYEQLPKPIIVAIKDAEEGNIMYSYPQKDL